MILQRKLLVSALAVTAALVLGCGGAEDVVLEGRALFDGAHQPDVLTESRRIETPTSLSGNRVVTGWWPWKRGEQRGLVPRGPVVRLEGVNLGNRERNLVLDLEMPAAAASPPMGVLFPGAATTQEVAVAPRTLIPLPTDLPLGRFSVELAVPEGSPWVVTDAGFDRALQPGTVEIDGTDLVQSGHSLVDAVRPLEGATRLSGTFVPPAGAGSEQVFRLLVERDDGSRDSVFEWRQRWWWPFGGARRVSAPLGDGDGWARLRFQAEGEGPVARWQGMTLSPDTSDSASAAPLQPPPAPRAVVLYIMDALRADHVGHLGGPEDITPTLDRLAAEGVTFNRYWSVAPNTVPSMKTLFSGQMFLVGGGWKLAPDGPPTLADRFRAAGYNTGLFTGNGNLSPWRGLTRGFDIAPRRLHFDHSSHWSDKPYNDNAERVHAATLEWVDHIGAEENFFLHLQTIHPHNPYDPPDPFRSRFTAGIPSTIDGRTRTLLDIKRQRKLVEPADMERLRGLYAGGVAYNDAELERFMEELGRRFKPGELLFIFTSDHGEELFEHGGVLHGYTLYEEQLEIPLVFWWPGVLEPRRVDTASDTLDLHATLAALASGMESLEGGGRPLFDALQGRDDIGKRVRYAAASSLEGGIFAARSERYKVIWAPRVGSEYGMGQGRGRSRDTEYVFDLANDPDENENLAGSFIFEAAWLRERLLAWIELGKQLETGVDPEEMDPATRDSLRALGYLQ